MTLPKSEIDDTFGSVVIDGVTLDAATVRTLMAQSALPHLEKRVVSVDCPTCGWAAFSEGDLAFTPVVEHKCVRCASLFAASGRLRKTIANPLVKTFEKLGRLAPRTPRKHVMDLLPETL